MSSVVARTAVVMALCMSILGCAQKEEAVRNTEAPIGATTRFTAEEFSGDWIIAASFVQRRKGPLAVSYAAEEGRLTISSDELSQIAGFYRQGVPGELIPYSAEQETLVVMWVDDDFRTAVVGTASGSVGFVLDREGDLPADRDQAVRDILKFYGWDTSQLKRAL